ncbi:PP2C family protein-serine/threonine phosphatase [Streptomyces venezuelae ATCC 10712]
MLQRSLLPRSLPELSAVEAASRYLPADSHLGAGGDWFDVIALSGARVGLVVGDVVGHGLGAAATMGRLRAMVRTLAELDLAPDELLARLNDQVGRDASDESARGPDAGGAVGATCVYGIYDPASGTSTWAAAGHLPPAVVPPDGPVGFLRLPPGPPLGVGRLPYEAAEVPLAEGSQVVLFTDGLVEARGQGVDGGWSAWRRCSGSGARRRPTRCAPGSSRSSYRTTCGTTRPCWSCGPGRSTHARWRPGSCPRTPRSSRAPGRWPRSSWDGGDWTTWPSPRSSWSASWSPTRSGTPPARSVCA